MQRFKVDEYVTALVCTLFFTAGNVLLLKITWASFFQECFKNYSSSRLCQGEFKKK